MYSEMIKMFLKEKQILILESKEFFYLFTMILLLLLSQLRKIWYLTKKKKASIVKLHEVCERLSSV
jgi:hypothetical protein